MVVDDKILVFDTYVKIAYMVTAMIYALTAFQMHEDYTPVIDLMSKTLDLDFDHSHREL